MLQDTELLNDIYQNAEMGRDGIMTVVKLTDDPQFRQALEAQLNEYQEIFNTADQMLQKRNIAPTPSSPLSKAASYLTANVKTLADNSPSRIAEMMIQGSTMGITKLTRQLRDYSGEDKAVLNLAKKQLKTEQANIEEMKRYL